MKFSIIVEYLKRLLPYTPEEGIDEMGDNDPLEGLSLGKDSIVLDCGANVGEITEKLARTGATVYAFEPDPEAFAVLQKRFSEDPRVHCFNKAVYDDAGVLPLYLHKNHREARLKWSTGSSLVPGKRNVDLASAIEVEVIDLAEFIDTLPQRVDFVKMDVEGAECRIINHLIDCGTIQKIGKLRAETHARKIPSAARELKKLRSRLEREAIRNVELDWS